MLGIRATAASRGAEIGAMLRRGAVARAGQQRRGFLSMLGFGKKKDEAAPVDDYAVSQEEKDKLIEWVHQRERLPPMVESPIPALKQLGEQYARASKGCVRCTAERMSFNCPTSGFPSHCSKECWDSDEAHRRIAKDLRQVHQDHVDLRSGRKFREFIFPGPPDFSRMIDLNNWRAFLEDREFRTCIDLRVGDARSADQQELEALSTRHVSSVFTFPLTIAHAIFWQRAMGDPARLKKKDEDGKEIPRRITIVGARAEAKLPARAWLELHAIFPDCEFELHFVGPEVPEELHETEQDYAPHGLRLKFTRGMYEDVHEFHDLPDLFVIFNSGVGYTRNEDTWADALDLMFNKSNWTPVLMTSHNADDAARDYSYLSRRQDCRFLAHPAENPFMSLRRDVALNNLKYVIQSNHTYALVRGSPPSGVISAGSLIETLRNALR